jgi:phage terminase small subunit
MNATKQISSKAEQKLVVFAHEYIENGGNGTQAAIKAGWSAKTAYQAGNRALKNARVQEILKAHRQRLADEMAEKHGLTIDRILGELRRLALGDVRKLFNADGSMKALHEMDDDTAAMIAAIDVQEIDVEGASIGRVKKIKLWDKNSALGNAMKHLGLFERDNEQGKGQFNLTVSSDDADVL